MLTVFRQFIQNRVVTRRMNTHIESGRPDKAHRIFGTYAAAVMKPVISRAIRDVAQGKKNIKHGTAVPLKAPLAKACGMHAEQLLKNAIAHARAQGLHVTIMEEPSGLLKRPGLALEVTSHAFGM